MKTITVAQALIKCLQEEGVDLVFGYPGGNIMPVYDALYDGDLKHVLVRHEQGAVHAADGYARATGKVGVCMATSGPGATNLVTGIATAYMDSIPLVVFTGQVSTTMVGTDAFQEVDITGITIPITKYNFLVKDARKFPAIIKQAFHIARTGRPGPVLIDIPKDILLTKIEFEYPSVVSIRGYQLPDAIDEANLAEAAKMINEAETPVIYAGGGIIISQAADQLKALAEKADIPVTTTLMALGGFPEDHPLSMGMMGLHGTRYANTAISNCDLIVALGARFDDRVACDFEKFASQAQIVHIDVDPAEISKNVSVNLSIEGNAKSVLEKLIPLIGERKNPKWLDRIAQWKKQFPLRYENNGKLKAQYVIEKIREVTKGEAIIVTDVGQHQMWAAQYGKYIKPRTFISSGGLGTMGYGFPAAIGAQLGAPDKQVFLITGDGSFQMNMQEFATAIEQQLPVKIIMMNNNVLGMVRQLQEFYSNKRYMGVHFSGNPDFVKFAGVYDALGIRVEKPDELEDALDKIIKSTGPAILDCIVEPEENVYPIVLAGQPIDQPVDIN